MQTYWLYYRNAPISSVWMFEGATEQDVIAKAIKQHRAVPLCYPDAPGDFEIKLRHSVVRTFEVQPRSVMDGVNVKGLLASYLEQTAFLRPEDDDCAFASGPSR